MPIRIEPGPHLGAYFVSGYDRDATALMKQSAGCLWVPELKRWKVPSDIAQALATNFDTSLPLYQRYSSVTANLSNLHPWQREGVDFLLREGVGILNFDTGLGKSLTALKAIEAAGVRKALIVCPASVRANWEAEVAKHRAPYVVHVLWSGDDTLAHCDGTLDVVSYDWLREHWEAATKDSEPYDALIFDELHYCKNGRKARGGGETRTTAALALSRSLPNAMKIGLTATPVANRIEDIHAQVNILCPDRFSSWFRFVRDYCTFEEGKFGGLRVTGLREDKAEELQWRLDFIMLRKTKAEVAPELPPLQCRIEWLRNDAALSNVVEDVSRQELEAFANFAAPTKVRETVDRVIEAIQNGEQRVCVLTHLIDSAVQISSGVSARLRELYGESSDEGVVTVSGAVPAKRRAELLRQACAETDRVSVLVATMHSVGVGIDSLKVFKRVIFAELYWSPQVVIQAVGRFVRLGSGDLPVGLSLLAIRGTVDEAIALVLEQKISAALRVGGVGKDGETLIAAIGGETESDEDFLALIRDQAAQLAGADEYGVE